MGDNLVGALGPGEGVGAVGPAVDVDADGRLEVGDAVEGAACRRWDGLAVMMPKKISAMLSQLPDVGVRCMWTRGCLASEAWILGCLWVA